MVRLSNLLYLDRRMEVDWYLKSKQRNVNTRIKEMEWILLWSGNTKIGHRPWDQCSLESLIGPYSVQFGFVFVNYYWLQNLVHWQCTETTMQAHAFLQFNVSRVIVRSLIVYFQGCLFLYPMHMKPCCMLWHEEIIEWWKIIMVLVNFFYI